MSYEVSKRDVAPSESSMSFHFKAVHWSESHWRLQWCNDKMDHIHAKIIIAHMHERISYVHKHTHPDKAVRPRQQEKNKHPQLLAI